MVSASRGIPCLDRVVAIAGMTGLCFSAHAQSRDWIGGDGAWSTSTNWSDGNVPDTTLESASITNGSAVTLDVTFAVGGLTLGAADTLRLPNTLALQLNLSGDVANDGVITLDGVTAASRLNAVTDVTFSGSGEVVASPGGVNTNVNTIGAFSGAGSIVTNAANHTIRALGLADLGSGTALLDNAGLVVADGATAELQFRPLGGSTATNTGTLRADAGTLRFLGTTPVTVDNTGGLIEGVNGGKVELVNATITGGTLNGDVVVASLPTISDLTTTADIDVVNDNALFTAGNIVNNGTIT